MEHVVDALESVERAIVHLEDAEHCLVFVAPDSAEHEAIRAAMEIEEGEAGDSVAVLLERLIDLQDRVLEIRDLLSLAYSIIEGGATWQRQCRP